MRNHSIAAALAAALLLASAPAAAGQQSPASSGEENGGTAEKAPPAKPKKPKKICREDEHAYSRMPTRICKTAEEWEVEAQRRSGTSTLGDRGVTN